MTKEINPIALVVGAGTVAVQVAAQGGQTKPITKTTSKAPTAPAPAPTSTPTSTPATTPALTTEQQQAISTLTSTFTTAQIQAILTTLPTPTPEQITTTTAEILATLTVEQTRALTVEQTRALTTALSTLSTLTAEQTKALTPTPTSTPTPTVDTNQDETQAATQALTTALGNATSYIATTAATTAVTSFLTNLSSTTTTQTLEGITQALTNATNSTVVPENSSRSEDSTSLAAIIGASAAAILAAIALYKNKDTISNWFNSVINSVLGREPQDVLPMHPPMTTQMWDNPVHGLYETATDSNVIDETSLGLYYHATDIPLLSANNYDPLTTIPRYDVPIFSGTSSSTYAKPNQGNRYADLGAKEESTPKDAYFEVAVKSENPLTDVSGYEIPSTIPSTQNFEENTYAEPYEGNVADHPSIYSQPNPGIADSNPAKQPTSNPSSPITKATGGKSSDGRS